MLPTLIDSGRVAARHDDGGDKLRGWWLYCMLWSDHPLREKLTLFWHNHFATSIVKVQNPNQMFRQNCLLRTFALGKFAPFLQAVSKDGAMLLWLDSNSNVKGKPNENYARELMELFSLGVGNYTEKDIREGARAFTGWHTGSDGFRFNPRAHDDGVKTFLGRTGNWNGDDVVRIVLEQPAASHFLVRKLYQLYVSETASPPAALLEPRRRGPGEDDAWVATFLFGPCLSPADQEPGGIYGWGRASGLPARPQTAAAASGAAAQCDGARAVRAAECKRLAGRPKLAEYLDLAGTRQFRRRPGNRRTPDRPSYALAG